MAEEQKGGVFQTVDSMVEKFSNLPAAQTAGAEPREMPDTPSEDNRFFHRQKSVHALLGAGKFADILLWRNPLLSAGILAGITTVYVVFEWLGCHVLSLSSKGSLIVLTAVFVWSNIASLVKRTPSHPPAPLVSEERAVQIGRALREEANVVLHKLHDVILGKDIRLFVEVELVLWALAYIGKWADFLTTVYFGVFVLLTVPALYERHEEKFDVAVRQGYEQTQQLHDKLQDKVTTGIRQLSPTGEKTGA